LVAWSPDEVESVTVVFVGAVPNPLTHQAYTRALKARVMWAVGQLGLENAHKLVVERLGSKFYGVHEWGHNEETLADRVFGVLRGRSDIVDVYALLPIADPVGLPIASLDDIKVDPGDFLWDALAEEA